MMKLQPRKKLSLSPMRRWKPPKGWMRITAIDLHTGGEPSRVITSGFPELSGGTILERRCWAKRNEEGQLSIFD